MTSKFRPGKYSVAQLDRPHTFGRSVGDAAFTNPTPGFPFTVKDGVLRIEARKEANGKWRSGLLASADAWNGGFAQMYGYFEARIKLPNGPGTWPAFWFSRSWPRGSPPGVTVEIDLLEYYGKFPEGFHSVVHLLGC